VQSPELGHAPPFATAPKLDGQSAGFDAQLGSGASSVHVYGPEALGAPHRAIVVQCGSLPYSHGQMSPDDAVHDEPACGTPAGQPGARCDLLEPHAATATNEESRRGKKTRRCDIRGRIPPRAGLQTK
jgi:hypothetical protein